MLVLSAVTYGLTWYFIVNPSFPGGLGVLVALFSVFGFAYIILSSVESMIEEKAAA